MMHTEPHPILADIEAFLERTNMAATYFGKRAVNNSEVVKRLREGKPILNTTEDKLRKFMTENDKRSAA